jgi:hypothetical protein
MGARNIPLALSWGGGGAIFIKYDTYAILKLIKLIKIHEGCITKHYEYYE